MSESPDFYKQCTTGISYPVGDLFGYPDSLIRGRVAAAYKHALSGLQNKKVMDVLDFGSGRGHGVAAIQQALKPKLLVSLDTEQTYLDVAQSPLHKYKNIRFICTDNLSSFKDNSFDLIFCMHVIEHIIKPELLLRDFYRILRKGGVLIIATPDKNNLVGVSPYNEHVFDRQELKDTLEKIGFLTSKIKYIVADQIAFQVHRRKQWLADYQPDSVKIRDKIVTPDIWDAMVLRSGITTNPLTEANFPLSLDYSERVIDFLVSTSK